MKDYMLRPGGRLVAQPWARHGDDDGVPASRDVSDCAHQHLFEKVGLDSALTLADVFRLLDRDPVLRQVFRRDFVEELCAESRKPPPSQAKTSPPAESIEYLELAQVWHLDTSNNAYLPTQRLEFQGIGTVLQDDAPVYHRKRGERITWSVSLTPLHELLHLPLRFNEQVTIMEDDIDSRSYGREVSRATHAEPNLGQVIDGVLWELSFHGGPDQQAEFSEELTRRTEEVDRGTAKLIDADGMFENLHQAGCAAMFEDIGVLSSRAIKSALHEVGDEENVHEWFEKKFGGTVVVRRQFRDRGGRAFRQAFRAAGR